MGMGGGGGRSLILNAQSTRWAWVEGGGRSLILNAQSTSVCIWHEWEGRGVDMTWHSHLSKCVPINISSSLQLEERKNPPHPPPTPKKKHPHRLSKETTTTNNTTDRLREKAIINEKNEKKRKDTIKLNTFVTN